MSVSNFAIVDPIYGKKENGAAFDANTSFTFVIHKLALFSVLRQSTLVF